MRNQISRGPVIIKQAIGMREVITVPMSFETGEQTVTKIYLPYKAVVKKIRSIVTKAIAGTDNGTITPKNSAGSTMTSGVITHDASAALDTEEVATPTANTSVAKDSFFSLTSAKTTAGGKALVSVEIERA